MTVIGQDKRIVGEISDSNKLCKIQGRQYQTQG